MQKFKTKYGHITITGVRAIRRKNKDIIFKKNGFLYTISNINGKVKRKKISKR